MPGNKHFVVHMGHRKTGSSAFQTWLGASAASLAARGVLFEAEATGPTGNGGRVVKALMKTDDPQAQRKNLARLEAFRNAIGRFCGDTVVHSAERWFSAVAPSRPDGTYVAADVLRRAHHMAAGLRGLGAGRITAIIVLRNSADRAVSSVAQSLRTLRSSPSLASLPPPVDNAIVPYRLVFDALQAAGMEVAPVLHDPGDDPAPLAQRIFRAAGLEARLDGMDFSAEPVNRAMGVVGCHASDLVRAWLDALPTEPGEGGRGIAKTLLRTTFDASPLAARDAPFNGIGPERVAEIQARQAPLDAQLEPLLGAEAVARLGRTKWEGRPLSPLRIEELSPEQRHDVADLLRRFTEALRGHHKLAKVVNGAEARLLDRADAVERGTARAG